MEQIEEVIELCEAAAIFFGPNGPGRIQEPERQLLFDRERRQRGDFRLVPVLLPGSRQSDVTGFTKLITGSTSPQGSIAPQPSRRWSPFFGAKLRNRAQPSTNFPPTSNLSAAWSGSMASTLNIFSAATRKFETSACG